MFIFFMFWILFYDYLFFVFGILGNVMFFFKEVGWLINDLLVLFEILIYGMFIIS